MRGRAARWSPLLAQRAVENSPRWTRAVGDQSDHPLVKRSEQAWTEHLRDVLPERAPSEGPRSTGAVGTSPAAPPEDKNEQVFQLGL